MTVTAPLKPVASPVIRMPAARRYKPGTASGFDFGSLPPAPAPWLDDVRRAGQDALLANGLPTPKLERWKYTNLSPLLKNVALAYHESESVYKAGDKLVRSLPQLSEKTPEWLSHLLARRPVAEERYHDMMLWHLANGFLQDGLVIDAKTHHDIAQPVRIEHGGAAGEFYCPRLVIRLDEGVEMTVIETYTGEGYFWRNSVAQIIVGPNARLRHYRLCEDSHEAVNTGNTHIQIQRDGTYEGFYFTTGTALSRQQVHAELLGENAACNLSAASLLRGSQHGEIAAEVEHRVRHGTSNQLVRTVLDDQARGVFQGKVYVHEGADQTDGYQLSNALILSEGAEMDTKPELEIYADEVKCSHGATTGKLDDGPLFYMRNRGLSEDEARALLIEAFIGEVVDELADESVKNDVLHKVNKWLG